MLMKWFKKKKKPNEEAGFLFRYDGLAIDASQVNFFPKLKDVFHDVSPLHKKVFFPLCSIQMSQVGEAGRMKTWGGHRRRSILS